MDQQLRRRQWYAMRQRLRDAGLWHGKITDDVQQDIRKYGKVDKKKTSQPKRAHSEVDPEPDDDPEEGTSSVAGIMFYFFFFRKHVYTSDTREKRSGD